MEIFCYVKERPLEWGIPTHILCGENDNLTSYETMSHFADKIGATLTVMKRWEHWFHYGRTNEISRRVDKKWLT